MIKLTDAQRGLVLIHIRTLRDNAASVKATSDHFRPECEFLLDNPRGALSNYDKVRAAQLRDIVSKGDREAKETSEIADALEILLTGELPSSHPSRIPHSDGYGY